MQRIDDLRLGNRMDNMFLERRRMFGCIIVRTPLENIFKPLGFC
jgi:hypothetical protein